MNKFTIHTGIAAPLLRINVDTDAIIPSRRMRQVSKKGLGVSLFYAWRYLDDNDQTPNPDFVLNQPAYHDASILLAGSNFGCGSSREHAVWALAEFGFRAIIAPGFGSIFQKNCLRNGVLPIVLDADKTQAIAHYAVSNPQQRRITIDLPEQRVRAGTDIDYGFEISARQKHLLVEGLNPITHTLTMLDEIDEFIRTDQKTRPWVYVLASDSQR